MPKKDARGEYPAAEYARASLARKIVKARRLAGLSQAAPARRASVRPACHGEAQRSRETLNRIERGRTTPDTATLARIERALDTAHDGTR